MPTYLLTWNPSRWHWDDLQEHVREVREKGYTLTDWSCGRSKKIREGDRLFMICLGRRQPRGIFASGYAVSNVYEEQHWDESVDDKPAHYINLHLNVLLNPKNEPIFPRADLNEGILKDMHWDSQSSGVGIPDVIAAELETRWASFLANKEIYETRFYQSELSNERQKIETEGYFDAKTLEDARQRVSVSIVQRQGQSGFRRKLLTAYCGRCSITGCDVEPALEAAHIIPYKGTDTNHPANGLLLRADFHTLFDLHLLSIHPDTYEVVIAPALDATCYADFKGKRLSLPKNNSVLPDRIALTEHYKTFLQKRF